jgi:hypothetical protein
MIKYSEYEKEAMDAIQQVFDRRNKCRQSPTTQVKLAHCYNR